MKTTNHANRLGGILAGACLAWLCLGGVQVAQAAYHAVLVGIDHYSSAYGAGDLSSCRNDARGFRAKLLKDTNRWKSGRITKLEDSAATEAAIKSKIRAKASALVSGDVFVYFHSSHGGQYSGPSTYLCTYASDFTDTELGQELARFRRGVKIIVVIDACHSAGMFKSATDADWPFAANVSRAFEQAKAKAGVSKSADLEKLTSYMGFITACDYNQSSWSGDPYSVYVAYVLRSCGVSAADNAPRNGYLSFWEAHRYAKPRASQQNSSQTAQYRNGTLLQRTTMVKMAVNLAVPTPIGPTGTTVARPLFSWRAASGASSYQVQVYNSSGRLIINRTGLGGTSYRPGSNMANGSYTWRVRAVSGSSASSWSGRLGFTVSPSRAYVRRITLTWGSTPRDLDAHLITPTRAHILYNARGSQVSAPYAHLDTDDQYSYGPENISVYRLVSASGRSYKYFVYNWSNERNLAGCGARVSVQSRTSVLRNYICPSSGSGRYWHVFNMSANGTVTSVNRIRTSAP